MSMAMNNQTTSTRPASRTRTMPSQTGPMTAATASTSKSETTKLAKRQMILDYLYTHKKGSRQDIALAVPCSLPIIAQNLAVLEDEGLIQRTGFLTSTGGRKPQNYAFIPEARIAVGVSVFSDGMDLCAADLNGRRLAFTHVRLAYENTARFYDAACNKIEDFINALAGREREALAGQAQTDGGVMGPADFDRHRVLGVAFSVQGRVSPDGEQITFGGILGNTGLSVAPFAARLPYPCQFIHDSYSAASTEVWFDPTVSDAYCLYLNEHVGSAVIVDGRVRQGTDLRSGNCEHMRLVPGGRACYCGQRGCVDAYCSREALLGESGTDLDGFFDRLHAGDETCVRLFNDYLDALAQTITNMRMVFSVDVILGGEIARRFSEADMRRLADRVRALDPFPESTVQLRKSVDEAEQSTLGAALHYIRRFVDANTGR
ncbi:ROK family protein [Bifidobacterium vansinderenii]|uniref:NagC family transcriptional regulator n=1 Tax=Bifidobacterium vansinderenii TaxID=1984871 RepID=A0A229VWK2_9BIFI|nr:ROK family protein [Bifidobacterium vansinderenii]OXM99998.1 NagC family transcriptional regulator [Bifidobacterium vansinderenii]